MQSPTKSELIKELRELTQAGMKDCADALKEANDDIQAAVDIIKAKGKNIVSGRSGKIASEGIVAINQFSGGYAMVEVNCQTDFVANSPEFKNFADNVAAEIVIAMLAGQPFDVSVVEKERAELVSRTKENIVIRRWWVEEALDRTANVFSYVHSNKKIGVLMTVKVSREELWNNPFLKTFADGLVMQVAAMNPISISPETLPAEVVARQRAIFESQLREANKPETAWEKIINGKFNKWYSEACLLNQESIMSPKKTVKEVLDPFAGGLSTEIEIINFIRCQVGEGIETKQENFADEVAKLV